MGQKKVGEINDFSKQFVVKDNTTNFFSIDAPCNLADTFLVLLSMNNGVIGFVSSNIFGKCWLYMYFY